MLKDFASLSSREFEKLNPDKTLFIFPMGSLQAFGPHLPMNTGSLLALQMAQALSRRLEIEMKDWQVISMPEVPLSIDRQSDGFGITVRPYVVRDYLVDSCRALMKKEFRYFACITGTPGAKQLTAIEEAGKMLVRPLHLLRRRRAQFMSIDSANTDFKTALKSPFRIPVEDHGGKLSTSRVAAFDPSKIKISPEELKQLPESGPDYFGNPGAQSPEIGTKAVEQKIENIFPKVRAVLEGSNARYHFRSWYSLFPPNWSFFKAWIIFILTLILMMIWVWVTLGRLF